MSKSYLILRSKLIYQYLQKRGKGAFNRAGESFRINTVFALNKVSHNGYWVMSSFILDRTRHASDNGILRNFWPI